MSALSARIPGGAFASRWFEPYRGALATRDLRLLLGALLVSATGTWAYNVALFAFVFGRTHSLAWVGAAGFVRFLPALVVSPFAGLIGDRTERVRLLISSDLLSCMFQGGLLAVAVTGAPVALALAFAALTAMTSVVYSPTVAAAIPAVVAEDELVVANALNGTIDNLVVIAGPAIGAALLLLSSAAWVFGVNAVSFLAAALLVSRIAARSIPKKTVHEPPLTALMAGFRTILEQKAARTLVAFSALVSFVYGTDTVLFVGVSAHRLGTGPKGYGYLLAGLGIGGIVMAAGVDRIARSHRLAPIILLGTAGYCLPTALLTLIHNPELAFAIQIVRGASTLVVDVLAITALQRAVPADVLARVFGVFFAFILGAITLGTVITPVVVNGFGLNVGLLTMAFGPTAIGLLGWRALASIDRTGAERVDALAPRVALLERLEIFATASRPLLERLAAAATEVAFPGGVAIVSEGDPADALYVLASGDAEVTSRGERGGPPHHLRTMSAPSYFGEIGVLSRIPRTATVTALTDCECLSIEGSALLDALSSTPPSSSLMENARSRLAVTHPSAELAYSPAGQ